MEEKTALSMPPDKAAQRDHGVTEPRRSLDEASGLEPRPLDLVSPQFTIRAVLTGMVLAGILSICNIYIGLRVGFVINMSLVAALLGYAFWTGLRGLSGGRIRRWEILENNISQTACSSGAQVASAGLVAPLPALALMTGTTLTWHALALWVFSVCLLGIMVAITIRRQMLLSEKLPFPLGTTSAEMLREIHTRGSEALARVKALLVGGTIAAVLTLIVHYSATLSEKFFGVRKIIEPIALPVSIKGFKAKFLTFGFGPTLFAYGIGGLIGFRACASLLLGAILAYGVLAPPLIRGGHMHLTVRESLAVLPVGVPLGARSRGDLRYDENQQQLVWKGIMSIQQRDALLEISNDPNYGQVIHALHLRSQISHNVAGAEFEPARPNFRDMLQWLVWPGMVLMVVSSLVSFAFSWRSVFAVVARRDKRVQVEMHVTRSGDLPRRAFAAGLIVALLLSVVLQISFFAIMWWAAVGGVLLAFVLAIVAARVSGETGITPVGVMGKISQLSLGFLSPQNAAVNLTAANVAGGAASQSADLLNDLKCGYLLGAMPRLQVLAQICGALTGALIGSAAYLLTIPNPAQQLFTDEWPAPAVAALKAVAELFQTGFQSMPEGAGIAMAIAALVAAVLAILEKTLPGKARPLVPSAASLGLAFVITADVSMSIFIGGLAALCLGRWCRGWTKRFLVATCAGIIAGESLTEMGIALSELDFGQLF